MLSAVVGAQALGHGRGAHPDGPGQRRRGGRVGHGVARRHRAQVGALGQGDRLVAPVVQERTVHEDPVHDADVGQARGVRGEADRAAALLDVRALHEGAGQRVLLVEHAGHPRVRIHLALGGGVLVHRAVPVHVVLGQVQHRR